MALLRLVLCNTLRQNAGGPKALIMSREFFITNDHYFALGPLRYLEEMYGPFTWSTDVQFCDASMEVSDNRY